MDVTIDIWLANRLNPRPVHAHEVLHLLQEMHDQGRTIVLITHDHEVASDTRRQVLICDGPLTEGLRG